MTKKMKYRPWEGGRIHVQADGRPLYIIARMVGGKRFSISTRTHTEGAAHSHLKRFEADPWSYAEEMKSGRPSFVALELTRELVAEFWGWMTTRKHPKPATQRHANEMKNRLAEWLDDLRGMDLRKMDLRRIKEIVAERKTCAQHRIIALKGFCGWLRTEKFLLERKDDVTLDLAVPQGSPEKHRRRKAVPHKSVRAALRKLDSKRRDCLLLLAHTGWHVTELGRFARDDASRIAPGSGSVLAVLQVLQKTGATTRTPIEDKGALEAAKRIRARRELPRRLNEAIKEACRRAGVEEFTGGVMRHSVATWAIEGGSSPEAVAEFLNHKSKSTTLKFYADVAIPTLAVKLPKTS